ncbi:hypothetical protein OM416_19535 [Paenibacillus sp. LS1]|uniref:hypothetical protein n=1 Tax=Paenibacillus sp. LS1 TaxID=2992120 RepID=UPI00223219EF|nr:hypothetical protein [Paenibacillus sp. LS1]MCW3793789.1 hypothetical protein [Paenibacillus sp. LS1]
MSWESSETREPCKCGKGFILNTTRSDDWNRFEYSTRLQCDECRKKYTKYVYEYIDSGMSDLATCWVDKELYSSFKKKETELKEFTEQIIKECNEHMSKAYLTRWLAIFNDVPRTKKAVWELFKKFRITEYSYKTFCAYTDKKYLTELIESKVVYGNRHIILPAIGIEHDDFLDNCQDKVKEYQKTRDDANREMMKTAFR